jgi:hypothetical protein
MGWERGEGAGREAKRMGARRRGWERGEGDGKEAKGMGERNEWERGMNRREG